MATLWGLLPLMMVFVTHVLAQLAYFDITPSNTATLNGMSFELSCAKFNVTMALMLWANSEGYTASNYLVTQPGYLVAYNQSAGVSRLTAPSPDMLFGGTYSCTTMYAEGLRPYIFYAEVIMFAQTTPACQLNSTVAVEDDDIYITCELGYSGAWAPIMSWTMDDLAIPGATVINETTDTLVKYSVVVKATADLQGKHIVCNTEIFIPDLPPDHATNTPTYHVEDWNSTALVIHLPVREDRIQIEPNDTIYERGTTITCSAPFIIPPAERVEWRDSNGTVIKSDVQSAQFTTGQAGTYTYYCYIEHRVGDLSEQRTATTEYIFEVIVPVRDTTSDTISAVDSTYSSTAETTHSDITETTCIDTVETTNGGTTGSTYREESDECSWEPCQNGATCTADQNSYTCACAVGYSGSNCQTADAIVGSAAMTSEQTAGIGVGSVALVGAIACVVVVIRLLYRKKRVHPQTPKSPQESEHLH